MKLKGKKVAILVEHHYQDMEVWVPYFRLLEEGASVVFAGTGTAASYQGKYGYPVTPQTTAGKLKAANLDALVIPGGWAPDFLRRHASVLMLVREMNSAGKTVACICHGGWVLASAGILKGRTVTGFSAIKDDLIHAGAKYVDREVQVDKNLITSRTPDDLPAFCREIILNLMEN
ncbi:MAG: protease [Elusimicrobia bacterium RIFCSPLOWO2_01_FULL_54_10]|nr:MAG: protease [Elusimicrobia bacterium RIFCSPLOWO2_01_FULL_54_10]